MKLKPQKKSIKLLSITRSKAKMYEYNVPLPEHIDISDYDLSELFILTINILGNYVSEPNEEMSSELRFTSYFFDSFIETRLNTDSDTNAYICLLGAVAYYLVDLPGSAQVLLNKIHFDESIETSNGLDLLLFAILKNNFIVPFDTIRMDYIDDIKNILYGLDVYNKSGSNYEIVKQASLHLRNEAYKYGTPRELLLADIIDTVIDKKHYNSCWDALPKYSDISLELWHNTIMKDTFIKELWPSQHIIGQNSILKGHSGVIQMPTSAGKTKATELIIRSAFLSDRANVAIIVAPFRALCNEIRNDLTIAFLNENIIINEISDVLTQDYDFSKLFENKNLLVLTPEKLVYILRQNPEIAQFLGLVIFDEGHQFDNGSRGITYELLLTSLNKILPSTVQKILISAVISNAYDINSWLNEEKDANVVKGDLQPTYRSIGYISWKKQQIFYDVGENEYFVPRVIEITKLNKRRLERMDRYFPTYDSTSIALYLGLKLFSNGSVAIYCGSKVSVLSICNQALDAISRGLSSPLPITQSDKNEVDKLYYLYKKNFGKGDVYTDCAKYGIFSHKSNTPQGLRLAVEHAVRQNLIKFIVCTSTLAQGVNMPIKYIIVSTIYQGGTTLISTRDFHNLIGRAGRAGMYTEGSILFSDPDIYDYRKVYTNSKHYKWVNVQKLLNPDNSEPCTSMLLNVFNKYDTVVLLNIIDEYFDDPERLIHNLSDIDNDNTRLDIMQFIENINAIESFILSYMNDNDFDITNLSQQTLAYHLADESIKQSIKDVFLKIYTYLSAKVHDIEHKSVYGKTLYGLNKSLRIEEWVTNNISIIANFKNHVELFEQIWPILLEYIDNNTFQKCIDKPILYSACLQWLNGDPFIDIYNTMQKTKKTWGQRTATITMDDVVDIFVNGLSFDGSLLINGLLEFIYLYPTNNHLINALLLIQKQIKYGLLTSSAISLYEYGFADRVIAQELASIMAPDVTNKYLIQNNLHDNHETVKSILSKYPEYYSTIPY